MDKECKNTQFAESLQIEDHQVSLTCMNPYVYVKSHVDENHDEKNKHTQSNHTTISTKCII